jgi:hypothetical protein
MAMKSGETQHLSRHTENRIKKASSADSGDAPLRAEVEIQMSTVARRSMTGRSRWVQFRGWIGARVPRQTMGTRARQIPRRTEAFLQDACMAREMYRL